MVAPVGLLGRASRCTGTSSATTPREITGHGIKGLEAVVLGFGAPLLSWATIQSSDAGRTGREPTGQDGTRTARTRVACLNQVNVSALTAPASTSSGCRSSPTPMPSHSVAGRWSTRRGRAQWPGKGQVVHEPNDERPGEFKGGFWRRSHLVRRSCATAADVGVRFMADADRGDAGRCGARTASPQARLSVAVAPESRLVNFAAGTLAAVRACWVTIAPEQKCAGREKYRAGCQL